MTKNQITAVGGIILILLVVVTAKAINPTKKSETVSEAKTTTVEAAWNNLVQAKSTHMTTTLDLLLPHTAAQAANQPIVDIAIKTEGDALWKEKTSYVGTFSITTKGRGMQLFTDGEIAILPNSTKFKLQNLPTLLNPSGNLLNKWTEVNSPLLRTTNSEQVLPALQSFFSTWSPAGTDNGHDRYEKKISEEHEQQLEKVFKESSSGNQALHVLARLLKNFHVEKAEAWVVPNGGELKKIKIHFTNPTKQDQQATLQFEFNDRGKEVVINIPNTEATVQPDVFTQLFGEPKPLPTPSPAARIRR